MLPSDPADLVKRSMKRDVGSVALHVHDHGVDCSRDRDDMSILKKGKDKSDHPKPISYY